MARSLIVLPDDTAKPVVEAIDGARRSLRIKMFVFSDPALLNAVIAAKRRGVDTRVMLNPHRRSGEQENTATRRTLERAGVTVKNPNPAFDVTPARHITAIITEAGVARPPYGPSLAALFERP